MPKPSNERLYWAGIITVFVLGDLLTMAGYISLVGTISATIQLEKSFMLAYMIVKYSTLTNCYKKVMCLVGLMIALGDIEVAECQFGMVPSFYQINWCPYSSYIQFSTTNMHSEIRTIRRQPCLIVMLTAPYLWFSFDRGGSFIKRCCYLTYSRTTLMSLTPNDFGVEMEGIFFHINKWWTLLR